MKLIIRCMLLTLLVSAPAIVFAQDKTPDMELKGKLFFDWTRQFESKSNGEEQNDDYQTFNLGRAYLTWKKKLNSTFSIRVTSDIMKTEASDNAAVEGIEDENNGKHNHSPKHSKYDIYLKYGYLQGKHSFGDLEVKSMIGLTKTSAIGFIDDTLTGTRYINKNFIDSSKTLIGTSIDHSADLGINLNLKYAKLVELNTAYVNGEGYKQIDVTTDDQGKQMAARLSIIPLPGIYVNTYFSNTDNSTKSSSGDNYTRYYGGGLAWVHDIAKVGANYIIVDKVSDSDSLGDFWLADSWARVNLTPLVEIPVFFYGRLAMGENKDEDNSQKTYIGAGAGYTYSKDIEVIAFYNQLSTDTKKESLEKQFQIKAQVKF